MTCFDRWQRKRARRKDRTGWGRYEQQKSAFERRGLDSKEYEAEIKALAERLGL